MSPGTETSNRAPAIARSSSSTPKDARSIRFAAGASCVEACLEKWKPARPPSRGGRVQRVDVYSSPTESLGVPGQAAYVPAKSGKLSDRLSVA